ncbi:MAG: hypothetical protein KAR38_08495, partial [Calditrichia bacterium]|nr:hypothetical protein [Calditrichia bacterium]
VESEDMWIGYTGFKNSHIKFGNFKMPLGLNELTSSRFLTFTERAYPMMAFETDRNCGLEYSKWGKYGKTNINFRGALYGQDLNVSAESDYEKEVDETGYGIAGRLVVAPQISDDLLIHSGFAAVYETPDDESEMMEFKSEAETKIGDIELLDTGKMYDVDHSLRFGLEGAVQFKNICMQGEYIKTNVIRLNGKQDATFDGGYAFISWILTGEKRNWSVTDGEFGQVIPKDNKKGAWEVAFRYSHLNLSDKKAEIFGGKANNYTFGLNWYANANLKFQFNYTIVDQSQTANSDGDYSFGTDGYDFNYLQFMAVVLL